MPRGIVDKVNGDLGKIFRQAVMKEKVLALGGIPIQTSAEEFTKYVQGEMVKWAKIVKSANIRVE